MINKSYRKATTFLGKRGAACLWFGFIFIVIGISYLLGITTNSSQLNLQVLTNIFDIHIWGAIWTLGGTIFLAAAFWKRLQLIAFMIGMSISLSWSAGIALQTFFAESQRGFVSASIYMLFAALIYLISTWAEPHNPMSEIGENEDGS
jgi:hypothetical protein